MVHLPARVGPRSKLEVALLIVEGKPGDVDLASRLEEAGRYVEATSVTAHHHIRLVRPVELLVRAACTNFYRTQVNLGSDLWVPISVYLSLSKRRLTT